MSDSVVDPYFHTDLCNIYIKHYKKCIAESSILDRLLTGPCDIVNVQMKMCFQRERAEKGTDQKAFKRKLKEQRAAREQAEKEKYSQAESS